MGVTPTRCALGSVVRRPVRVGFLPPAFQSVQEAGFDFGGDVAVDLDQTVGQVVAQAFGLSDFGDAVSDEPGLVTVPQPVKGQPGPHRMGAFAVVAIDSRPEHSAVKCAGEMVTKFGGQEWRQGDGAG